VKHGNTADWLATQKGAVYIEGSLPVGFSRAGPLRWVADPSGADG
jgi:hypothetical protein